MKVTECVTGMELMTADEARHKYALDIEGNFVRVLGAVSSLCNAIICESSLNATGDNQLVHNDTSLIGNATEKAIFGFCETMHTCASKYFRSNWQLVHDVSFDSKYKVHDPLLQHPAEGMPREDPTSRSVQRIQDDDV